MPQRFASQHTTSFSALLSQLGCSLAITTYDTGQLVLLRARGPAALNTHFCALPRPMGCAADAEKLAIGTGHQVVEMRNMVAVAEKLPGDVRHDACYLPRQVHVTGDIDIHELAYAADSTLWLVNTRMSCLCTLDREHSVVPRWRPPFISGYDVSDRCHLNGLAMRDGEPAFVTALGTSDAPAGWREHKIAGGVVIDTTDGSTVAGNLSMPHSPRWYDDRLWVLESGAGTLITIDPGTGDRRVVAELPGFTRGLAFAGRYAFVGLSEVRETNVFAGLPLTQRTAERHCGVWVVDIRTGETVAYTVFRGDVRELFAVTLVPARHPHVVTPDEPLARSSYALPDEALGDVVPEDPRVVRFQRALALARSQRFDEAIPALEAVLAEEPDHVQALYHLGACHIAEDRWLRAVDALSRCVAIRADHAEAQNSLGMAYSCLGDWETAIERFEAAIAADQAFATARFNRSLGLLRLGRYREGWPDYECRWQLPSFERLVCPQPEWQGEDISGKVLLVHTEQGAGDAMQFARFLPIVAKRCRKLIVAATENLKPILQQVEGVDHVRLPGRFEADTFDVFCPIMSLAHRLEIELDTIPAAVPYLTAPPDLRVDPVPDRGRPRIGFVWRGSPTYRFERQRGLSLELLAPLVDLPFDFYTLQTPLDEADLTRLEEFGIEPLEPDNPAKTHFGRTAACLGQLDLLICSDTSVSHLAGAMNLPTWILLHHEPDWRWMTEREDSPWYPSVRLFRQKTPGDWPAVIARVRKELELQRFPTERD
ncbi:MAG: TIGR03032 family protein [Pseudomonadota bacterium]